MSDRSKQSRLIASNAQAVTCAQCDLPAVEIRNGSLVVKVRHHGAVHENVFSLDWLKRMIEQSSGQPPGRDTPG